VVKRGHTISDAGRFRVRGDAIERDARHVQRRDPPALVGKPDGIGALAGADVQRITGWQSGHVLDEAWVRLAAPDALGLGVPRVPGLLGVEVGDVVPGLVVV
jgi:hypothetical protein